MYVSTRNSDKTYSTAEVICGINPADKGLIVPNTLPNISNSELEMIQDSDFIETAAFTLNKFFPDIKTEDCLSICKNAFEDKTQDDFCSIFNEAVPSVVYLSEDEAMLELNKGQTSCCVDYTVKLLVAYIKQNKAFFERKQIEIVTTENNFFCSIEEEISSFENIKAVYLKNDKKLGYYEKAKLKYAEKKGGTIETEYKYIYEYTQTKSNSDNIIIYLGSDSFFNIVVNFAILLSAYADMLIGGSTDSEGKINLSFSVDSYGLLPAAIYFKNCTRAVNKVILSEEDGGSTVKFIKNGTVESNYDYKSIGFERIYFELTGRNYDKTADVFSKIEKDENYTENGIKFLTKDFYIAESEKDDILDSVADFFEDFGYVCDYLTGKGIAAADEYFDVTSDETPILYCSLDTPLFSPEEVYLAIAEIAAKSPFIAQKQLITETGEEMTDYIKNVSDEAKNIEAE